MKRLRMIPSLGGWLSIANMLMLLTLVFLTGAVEGFSETLFAIVLCALTVPLAVFWMLPGGHRPGSGDVVLLPIILVTNAFLRGYGLARIVRWFSHQEELSNHEKDRLSDLRKRRPATDD